MDSISVIGLTSAIFIATCVAFLWAVGKMNDVAAVVQLGVIQGMPIPIKSRWLWLHQVWTMYALAITASTAVVGFAMFRIAQHATEADVKGIAYMYAFTLFVGSLGNLATGISAFVLYVSVLREAEGR